MNINHRLPGLTWFLLAVVSCAGQVLNLDLSRVPANLPPAQRKSLQNERDDLVAQGAAFENEYAAFRRQFTGTVENTPRAGQAKIQKASLKAKADDLVDASDEFNRKVAAAVKSVPPPPKEPRPVSPAWFAMPNQAKFAQSQIDALNQQKALFEKQLKSLKGIGNGERQLLLENKDATLDLINDTECQAIMATEGMLALANLPPKTATALGTALPAIQGYFIHRGFKNAKEESQAREKMLEGIGALKNFALSLPGVLPGPEGESIKAVTDGILKIYNILERHAGQKVSQTQLQSDLGDVEGVVVDITRAVEPKVGGAAEAMVAFSYMQVLPWALAHLERDRTEIERGRKQSTTAVRYYEDRLSQVDKDISFWQSSLKQATMPK